MNSFWFTVSALAFIAATVFLLISGFVLFRLLAGLTPLLDETKNHIQDMGDLAANTVGRASETMELVELRVSQAMGQATLGGKVATRQAVGVGSVLAGVYIATRVASLLRDLLPHRKKRS